MCYCFNCGLHFTPILSFCFTVDRVQEKLQMSFSKAVKFVDTALQSVCFSVSKYTLSVY